MFSFVFLRQLDIIFYVLFSSKDKKKKKKTVSSAAILLGALKANITSVQRTD